ncbi:amino acid adenylation domain-containing protein [Mucilaginibacter corticis]|uniref:Amino acid adenylation domain-containing protein n=1 Tax=Mucilaginibacter corticis TaxID=2597670 RepID=A0A556MLE8_9SPHI|nr:amino acid adenylation domain-containing protein [Mucilaginibacter corticis]TSJ40756.1 amino acid adenylation domain-containing protein [Mucilaginibacter corticis]
MITVDQLVANQSHKFPDKVAIKQGDKGFTYKQVNEISNQLSFYLKDQGVKTGDVVALAIDRSPEMVISLLAIMKAGATYLPIDIGFPIDRISYMLNDAAVKLLITSNKFQEKYQDHTQLLFIEEAWQKSTSYSAVDFTADINEDTIAYILYTSGSTGKPKGVEVKHIGLVNFLISMEELPGANSNDVILSSTTISFDIAELEIYLPLITGASLVIASPDIVKDGRALLDIARKEKITIMQGTPFMWRMMLEADWNEVLPMKILCGGEAMTKELAASLVDKCAELWNMYGPTETTIWSTIKKITSGDDLITVGFPILNTQIYILNESFEEVPKGEVGEIYIGGTGVAKGYLNRPELTSERFIDDKFLNIPGQKIYKTGDLGKLLADDEILCLGRIDHQIKIRGYRIETEEVEFQIKQQPNVKDAIVSVFKDTLGNAHLVAYVVLEDPAVISDPHIWRTDLGKVLPEYMVPTNYTIIPAVPLMPNGKTDRKALPDPVINAQVSNKYEAPTNTVQAKLTDIFLKNVAVEKIGITDNFFELGINSLVSVKIMLQVEKEFGKRLPLSTLLKYPTIKDLALVIQDEAAESPYKALIPIKPNGSKPTLYIVHGIGLNLNNLYNVVNLLGEDQPVYGLQALGLDGTVETPDTLEAVAKYYNDEILKHDPVGPYAIAGYSFGGFIAYEMVKQLKKIGKDVAMLGMLDTNVQIPTHQYPLLKKIWIKGIRQIHKLLFRIGTIFTQPKVTLEYLQIYYTIKFKFFFKKFGFFKDYDPDDMPPFMQQIADKLNHAFAHYVVTPLDIKIDLFRADDRIFYVDDPKYLGWGKYALGGVEIHKVPGDHKELFFPPNDAIFAGVLQNTLDKTYS